LTAKLLKSPGEDRILTAYALSQKDAKVVYQSNAIVRTIVPSTMKQFLKQQLRWNRAWVHGSIFAGRFMWKKPLTASLIFYFYQFLAVLSPAIVIFWLFVNPFLGSWTGVFGFLGGTLYVGFLHGLNTWNYRETSLAAVGYRTIFVFLALFVTLTVVLYAWVTPWKMGWVTRTGVNETPIPEEMSQPIKVETIKS
jgi:hyaluronan synthase